MQRCWNVCLCITRVVQWGLGKDQQSFGKTQPPGWNYSLTGLERLQEKGTHFQPLPTGVVMVLFISKQADSGAAVGVQQQQDGHRNGPQAPWAAPAVQTLKGAGTTCPCPPSCSLSHWRGDNCWIKTPWEKQMKRTRRMQLTSGEAKTTAHWDRSAMCQSAPSSAMTDGLMKGYSSWAPECIIFRLRFNTHVPGQTKDSRHSFEYWSTRNFTIYFFFCILFIVEVLWDPLWEKNIQGLN